MLQKLIPRGLQDLHYENNHGVPMKQFWTDLRLELDSEKWKCPTDQKHIIEHSTLSIPNIVT